MSDNSKNQYDEQCKKHLVRKKGETATKATSFLDKNTVSEKTSYYC